MSALVKFAVIAVAGATLAACTGGPNDPFRAFQPSPQAVADASTGVLGRPNIFVETDPPGARCVHNGSAGETVLESTPGVIPVPVAERATGITCTREGYKPVTISLVGGGMDSLPWDQVVEVQTGVTPMESLE